jgi:hypothetical protein
MALHSQPKNWILKMIKSNILRNKYEEEWLKSSQRRAWSSEVERKGVQEYGERVRPKGAFRETKQKAVI